MTSESVQWTLLFDTDLFFSVKITDTLARAGYATRTVRRLDAFVEALRQRPLVALVNLAGRGVDWREAIRLADEAGVPTLAFGPHVEMDTQAEARRAGATTVVSNSQLAGDIVALVERTLRRAARRSATASPDASDHPSSGDALPATEPPETT